MKIGFYWAEPLMRASEESRANLLKPQGYLQQLKNRMIVIIDSFFSFLFAAYRLHKDKLIGRASPNYSRTNSNELKTSNKDFQKQPKSEIKPFVSASVKIDNPASVKIDNKEKKEEIESLQDFVLNGIQDEEIISIMHGVFSRDECIKQIALFRSQQKNEEETDLTLEEVRPQSKDVLIKGPVIILAEGGINQYQAGNPAACTSLACRFVASREIASSQMIAQLIGNNNYKGDAFQDTEVCIQQLNLKLAPNPFVDQRNFSNAMELTFTREGNCGIQAAVKELLKDQRIRGAVITANGITLGMRKIGTSVEFFDSHGDHQRTKMDNAAYVLKYLDGQEAEMAGFLRERFPDIKFTPSIQIWPIT